MNIAQAIQSAKSFLEIRSILERATNDEINDFAADGWDQASLDGAEEPETHDIHWDSNMWVAVSKDGACYVDENLCFFGAETWDGKDIGISGYFRDPPGGFWHIA